MIKESYVSFETAKLLKEKGFDGKCRRFANSDTFKRGYDSVKIITSKNLLKDEVLLPTLQMVMKWLREVHDLNINNELSIHGYFCSISHIVRDSLGYIVDVEDSDSWETAYYDTYEEACEAAIKYCLENLI